MMVRSTLLERTSRIYSHQLFEFAVCGNHNTQIGAIFEFKQTLWHEERWCECVCDLFFDWSIGVNLLCLHIV